MSFLILAYCFTACSSDAAIDILDSEEDAIEDEVTVDPEQPFDADINGDGELNILILGTSKSINNRARCIKNYIVCKQAYNVHRSSLAIHL